MAQVVQPDGIIFDVEPRNGQSYSLEEIQEYIGGYFQEVHLPRSEDYIGFHVMLCDEDGIQKNLQVNMYASIIAHQTIVGNIMTVRRCGEEYV